MKRRDTVRQGLKTYVKNNQEHMPTPHSNYTYFRWYIDHVHYIDLGML